MAVRAPTSPPQIDGFTYVAFIGAGGYADVFLYEQHRPKQQVAIKVLDPTVIPVEDGVVMFDFEADHMALVASNPYIIPVYQSGIAKDGRPFLVMEYYPGPNYYDRARNETMPVAEVLRVAIQLASAVETAHRAGIMHRDVKPANVLTSRYRKPGLTDFGIAATQGPDVETADALSIPWSPPEALDPSAPLDKRSDVYSLAATVYTMLAGRSPFEIPGGDNRQLSLMGRIQRNPVSTIGRIDVPQSLERVLANALAKDPSHRPASAVEFARQLAGVEAELQLAQTEIELEDDGPAAPSRTVDDDDDTTRLKGITEIEAQPIVPTPADPSSTITGIPDDPSSVAQPPARRREGLLAEPQVGDTIRLQQGSGAIEADPIAEPTRRSRTVLIAGIAAGVLVLVVIASVVFGGGEGKSEPTPEFDETEVNDNIGQPVAVAPLPLSEIEAIDNGDGTYTFSWDDRGEDYIYAVRTDGVIGVEEVANPKFEVASECIEVEVMSAGSRLISAPTRGCVP